MSEEEMLIKARREYPINTFFTSVANFNCNCYVEHAPILKDNTIYTRDNGLNGVIYKNGEWAKIISTPNPKLNLNYLIL